MFEFQIVRYEGIDSPDELVIELISNDNPSSSETLFHQEYLSAFELKRDKDLMHGFVSVPTQGIISILFYIQDQEFGVVFHTELLAEIKQVQYLPLYSPAKEIESLEETVKTPRILIAGTLNKDECSDFYTNFSFYVYKKYIDLKRTAYIEGAELNKKQKFLEFEALRINNEFSIQRALKDDKTEELEVAQHRNMIVKANMEAVVNDLEQQRTVLEAEVERRAENFEKIEKFSQELEQQLEDLASAHEDANKSVQADVAELLNLIEKLKEEKCESEHKVKRLEVDKRMLEQSLTLEKLRNCAKGMKGDFYDGLKNLLEKETSGMFGKMIAEYEMQAQGLNEKYNESAYCIEKLEEKLKDSIIAYENLENSLNEKISCKSDKKRGIKQQLAQVQDILMKKRQKNKDKKRELQKRTQEFEIEIRKSQEIYKETQKKWENEKLSLLNKIESIKAQFDLEKINLIKTNEENIKSFEQVIKANKESFEVEKKSNFENSEKKLLSITQRCEMEKKKIIEEKQENVKEHEKVLNQTKVFYEQEKKKINEEKHELVKDHEKKLLNLRAKADQDFKKWTNEQNELRKEFEKSLAQAKAVHEIEKEKLLQEIQSSKSDTVKSLKELKATNEKEKEKLIKELQLAKSEHENSLNQTKSLFIAEKQKLLQDFQNNRIEFEKSLSQANSLHAAEKQKLLEELQSKKIESEKILTQTKESLKSDKEKSLFKQSQEFETLKKRLTDTFESEKLNLTLEKQENTKEFETLMIQTQKNHEKILQNLTQSYESKLKLKENTLIETEQILKNEISSQRANSESKITELSSQIKSKQEEVQELFKNLEGLKEEKQKISQQLRTVEEKLEKEKKEKTEQSEEFFVRYEEIKFMYEQTIVTEKVQNEESQKGLEIEIRTLKGEIASIEKEKNYYKEKLQQGQENFLIKLKVLQDENAFLNQQIQQNLEKYQEDLKFSQRKYENLKVVTEKQQELALEESVLVRDQLAQEIKHLSRQIQSINDLRLRENENSSQIIKDIKENMEIVLRNTTDHYESKITDLNKEILLLQTSMNTLSDQCDKKLKESNRSFKETTMTKVLSTCEFIENIHPLSAPTSFFQH